MVAVISAGTRKSRKLHQCFECYRKIAPRTEYGYQTNVYDGRIYTLAWHLDCGKCGSEYRSNVYYYDDGYPPLRDDWCESGDYKNLCDRYRGLYPHVVARMELTDQLRSSKNGGE